MLIEIYRDASTLRFHDTETRNHEEHWLNAKGNVYHRILDPCWHTPDTPCPAVEQERGEQS